jgi:hypothetical protein
MRSGNMTEALAKGPEEAIAQSEAHIDDYLFRGGADTEAEDAEVGEKFGVGGLIKDAWANAKETEKAWLEQATKSRPIFSSFLPAMQPPVDNRGPLPKSAPVPVSAQNELVTVAETGPLRRLVRRADGTWWSVQGTDIRRWLGPPPKPTEAELKTTAAAVEVKPVKGAVDEEKTKFKIAILSDDEKKTRVAELAAIFESDKSDERLRYNTRKAEIAEELGVTQMDVHRGVMKHVEEKKKAKQNLTQSQKVVALALDQKVQLWIDASDKAAHVSVMVGKHVENYRIGDSGFESWVRAEYGRRHSTEIEEDGFVRRVPAAMSAAVLNDGMAMLKAMAAASGREDVPALRVGGAPGEVWLDLGRKDWALVKVTKDGRRLITEGVPGVRFVRKPGMLPLPIPVGGGNIWELRGFLNVRDRDFVLDVGWLLGAMRLAGSYPLMCRSGLAGTAKTTGLRVLQRLVDPHFIDVRPFKGQDDLFVGALNSWILPFDNLSRIRDDESDALAMISTGTGYGKRQLYTDAGQFMIRVARPILLAGIPSDLAERDDLASRAIVLELPMLSDEEIKYEEELWVDFEEARPRILGALLDGVVGALRGYQAVDLRGRGRIRMADFARWAEAGCRALGFRDGEFLDAFVANQGRTLQIAFRRDPVAQAVELLIKQSGGRWAGNTKPLLTALQNSVKKAGRTELLDDEEWPGSDVWLGRKLRRSAAVLRKVCGIEIKFDVDLRASGEGDKDGLEIRKMEPMVAEVVPANVPQSKSVSVTNAPVARPSWRRI